MRKSPLKSKSKKSFKKSPKRLHKKSPKKSHKKRLRGGVIQFFNGHTMISSGLGSDMEWRNEIVEDTDNGTVRDTIRWTPAAVNNYTDPNNLEALGFLNQGGIPYQLHQIDNDGNHIFTRVVPSLQFLINTLHTFRNPANPNGTMFTFGELEPWSEDEMEDDEVIFVNDQENLKLNSDHHCRIVIENFLHDYRCNNNGTWIPALRYE